MIERGDSWVASVNRKPAAIPVSHLVVAAVAVGASLGSACKCEPSREERYALAQKADRPGNRARALEEYLRACALGVAAACNDASASLTTGDEIPADPGRAFKLLERACQGEDLLACANISAKYRSANQL